MIERDILKSVIQDNQNEVPKFEVYSRNFKFEEFGNYVLVGIRRAGKFYLLYHRMQELLLQGFEWSDMLYINFEDEIQNIDGWGKFARRLADTKHRVYITGSNAKMLSHDVHTTLGGRYITITVYPYSFEDYFNFGGFPEGAQLSAKRDYLTSVYQKVYLGDIVGRNSIENTFALRILFKKIAESIKQLY